jgi:hypothetical protein
MSEFVFLYRGGEMPASTSPEQGQQIMQKWMAWFKDLAEKGHLVERGQPLERTGTLLERKQGVFTDGPFVETKDVVGGFSIIKADSVEQATELAKGCPFFERGGYVEVRPIMNLDM